MGGGRFALPLGVLYPVLYRFLENGYLSGRDEIVNKRLRKTQRALSRKLSLSSGGLSTLFKKTVRAENLKSSGS